jgi:hypothetical protein
MVNVTLDMNCIIDLENGQGAATHVKSLIKTHEEKKIKLRVVAISASEKKRDGTYASNFSEFKNRIAAIGLGATEVLKPLGYFDITYYDWCVAVDGENGPMVNLERKVHETLFPEIQFSYQEFCKKSRIDINAQPIDHRWRNAKCDVLSLWCHIYYGSGIFVTEDNNFRRPMKKRPLMALGAGEILRPEAAVVQIMERQQNRLGT